MNLIIAFLAGYLLVSVVLNLLALRYRRRLVALVDEAKADVTDERLRASLDSYVLSMRSMRTAVILALIHIHILLMPKEKLKACPQFTDEENTLWRKGLMAQIMDYHIASAAAANPLFGALTYVLSWAVVARFKVLLVDNAKQLEAQVVDYRYARC